MMEEHAVSETIVNDLRPQDLVGQPAAAAGDNSTSAFDVEKVREDFPILKREIYGKPLVYLDSAASAQKPRQVIQAMTDLMETSYSNVHRGVHKLSQESTDLFERSRETVARFLNAAKSDEIVFTRGATEAINLVAATFGPAFLKAGDEIIVSQLEHHSNIVPWQLLRDRLGLVLKVIPAQQLPGHDVGVMYQPGNCCATAWVWFSRSFRRLTTAPWTSPPLKSC